VVAPAIAFGSGSSKIWIPALKKSIRVEGKKTTFSNNYLTVFKAVINYSREVMNMQCPVCNIDLLLAERNGIEIDYCSKCRGIWLDRGELDKIIDKGVV